ncbi:MAG: LD-carboxypeptidase, partial [Bacteroidota bacterium]|nr:LD-carboxypeptidase [Bacteroidota bacterium]
SETQLDTRDKILFIEEIGEYKYHIDRMMQSLKRAGYFEHCAAVVVGDMMEIKSNSPTWGSSTEALIMEVLKPYKFPIAFGIPCGHAPENRALIFGRHIELSVSKSETVISF